jgi:hypothetical protein
VHLLYPYGKSDNWIENTVNYSKISTGSKIKSFNFSDFKIFSINVPPNVLFFSLNVELNECFKMETFISDNTEINYKVEKDYGYTIALNLENTKHDLSIDEINKGLDEYKSGSITDFSNRILNFRLNNNLINEPVKINFFCAYWKQKSFTNTFQGSIDLLWENDGGENKDPGSEKYTFETEHKHWLTLSNEMMLYQLSMYAEDYPEMSIQKLEFEQRDQHYTQNVI